MVRNNYRNLLYFRYSRLQLRKQTKNHMISVTKIASFCITTRAGFTLRGAAPGSKTIASISYQTKMKTKKKFSHRSAGYLSGGLCHMVNPALITRPLLTDELCKLKTIVEYC